MIEITLTAFTLGFIDGFVPGPVLTMLLAETLQHKFRGGLKVYFWAMFFDLIVAGGFIYLFQHFSPLISNFAFLELLGGITLLIGSSFLLYLGQETFRIKNIESEKILFSSQKIFLLTITSVPLYLSWITINFPKIALLGAETEHAGLLFFFLFESGYAVSTLAILLLFVFARQVITNEKFISKMYMILGGALFFFGIRMLEEAFSFLI